MSEKIEESKAFAKRIENMVRKEKKKLVWRETVSSILSSLTTIVAPWSGQNLGFLAGYAGIRDASDYEREAKMYEQDIDYRRINNKMFQEFAHEADTTMPEIEREAKDATFLKGCIDKLASESVRYIRSKTQMTGGWFGTGISMMAMTIPSLFNATTAGLSGALGSLATAGVISACAVATSLGMSISSAKLRRRFMALHNKHLNTRWSRVDKAKHAVLANPALKSATDSSDRMFQKLNMAVQQEETAFGRALHTLMSTFKKIKWTTVLVNVGVLSACKYIGMDIATAAPLFMGINVMNGSLIKILDAHYRLKETSDSMNDQYQKFRHNRIYDILHGRERPQNQCNAIQLDHPCYCHRYKGHDTKRVGMRSDIPVIQSDKTIIFKPGINVLGGSSGSGKSTLYKLLRHADDLTYGSISYGTMDGDRFTGIPTTKMPRGEVYKHIAFCFQEIEKDGQTGVEMIQQVNPYMPVEHIEAIASQLNLGLYKETPSGREAKQFSELSGGEKKRVLFLQAYLSPKQILVFDEPTSGVDEATAGKMIEMLNHDCLEIDGKKQKRTIIYTTHHPEELRKLNVNQVVDLAPMDDEKKIAAFIQKHGVTRLPSQITVHPFSTPEEKDKYILLASSRNTESRGSNTEISDNVNKFISMSIAARLEREAENEQATSRMPSPSKSLPIWQKQLDKSDIK